MKLHQSKVLHNLENFRTASYLPTGLMREMIDSFLIWKTIEYFQPKTLIEIGFFAGQTLGLMYESAGPDAYITSVDNNYSQKNIFENVFPDSGIEFIEVDSKFLSLNRTYDFIHIDGNHNYDYVLNDINTAFKYSTPDTIIYVDDYKLRGVDTAIQETLLGQNGFVPMLKGDMGVFFHRESHSADKFLDYWIQQDSKNFIQFDNINFFGFIVLEAKLPNLFVENRKMFIEACSFYNL